MTDTFRVFAGLALLFLVFWGGPARALDGNDVLTLELVSGEKVYGWYFETDAGVLVLTGDNRRREVPLDWVSAVNLNGDEISQVAFKAMLDEAQAELDAFRENPPPHPPPVVVSGLSWIWAGAGHAALGEWKKSGLYAMVDCVLWGTGAFAVLQGQQFAILIPLAGVEILFRGASAGQAARISRERRRLLEPLVEDSPESVSRRKDSDREASGG